MQYYHIKVLFCALLPKAFGPVNHSSRFEPWWPMVWKARICMILWRPLSWPGCFVLHRRGGDLQPREIVRGWKLSLGVCKATITFHQKPHLSRSCVNMLMVAFLAVLRNQGHVLHSLLRYWPTIPKVHYSEGALFRRFRVTNTVAPSHSLGPIAVSAVCGTSMGGGLGYSPWGSVRVQDTRCEGRLGSGLGHVSSWFFIGLNRIWLKV
jgi:hypothetical protein